MSGSDRGRAATRERSVPAPPSNAAGFTLIELLVVVAIIGLVAAIAIPNLINAIDRGRQSRTMADIKAIAEAMEAYSVDNSVLPVAANVAALAPSLEPLYMRTVPPDDGWSQAWVVSSTTTGYTLGSGGKDGGPLNFIGGTTSNFSDAIILINGEFVQWPEGTQQ